MKSQSLVDELRPIVHVMGSLDLSDPAAAKSELDRRLPVEGQSVLRVRELLVEGRDGGWLLPRENGGLRYGRVAKDLEGFSVDAVLMSGPGPRHRHPKGEVDLLFATQGSPRFDERDPGWTVFAPDSTHVPTVTDGEMLILYFLPEAAIEWL